MNQSKLTLGVNVGDSGFLFLDAPPRMNWAPKRGSSSPRDPALGYSVFESGGMVGGQPDVCAPRAFCVFGEGITNPPEEACFQKPKDLICVCAHAGVVRG